MYERQQVEMSIFCPETEEDIEELIELLEEREMSILVDMSNCEMANESILQKLLEYTLYHKSVSMLVNFKPIFADIIVCWSKKQEMKV